MAVVMFFSRLNDEPHRAKGADFVPAVGGVPDAAVIAAFRDGTPVVMAEGMAAGVPVIASRLGGLSEHIASEETGLLVQPDDSPALAEALRRVLAHPEEASTWAEAAQAHAREPGRRGHRPALPGAHRGFAAKIGRYFVATMKSVNGKRRSPRCLTSTSANSASMRRTECSVNRQKSSGSS